MVGGGVGAQVFEGPHVIPFGQSDDCMHATVTVFLQLAAVRVDAALIATKMKKK